MHARVITFEVGASSDLANAHDVFEHNLVPEMRRLPGYDGAYLLRDGPMRGLIVTLWEDAEALHSGEATAGFALQMEKLRPLLGRRTSTDSYEVGFADHPLG